MPLALLRSTHPGPALAVTVIVVVLAIGIGMDPWRVALLGLAMAFDQASVGLSNDWIDADRDRAVGRTDKPVAAGLVTGRQASRAAFLTLAASLLLTLPLGLPATLAHAAFVGSAWAYNIGLKKTVASVLPYVIGFGVLPSVVTLALVAPATAAPWATGMGAMLGIAAHFANALPDLDDDRITGVRGLPHVLGRTGSGAVTAASLLAAALFAFLGPGGAASPLQWGGLVATVLLTVAVLVLLRRPPSRVLFRLIMLAAIVDVVLLALSGERLLRP